MQSAVTMFWLKVVGKRAFSSKPTGAPKIFSGNRLIISPPLLDVDLPDIWTPNTTAATNHRPPPPSDNGSASECNAAVIDGKSIAEEIRSRVAHEIGKMKETIGKVPGLAVILLGQRRDSQTYVHHKIKACEKVGIVCLMEQLPDDCTEDEVLSAVSSFNKNSSVHGIIVQLPLLQHMNEEKILDAVSLEKDVDGLHPVNIGNLAMRGRKPLFIPCAPKACIELLTRSGVDLKGKKAVVIGRSIIDGLPTSFLLQRHHATVSIVHGFTKNPEQITCKADILVSAIGLPNIVRGNWIKPGAFVIDMGTNPVEDNSAKHGYRLTGDVCFEEAAKIASAISPVPGGIGPVTIAMLLSNILDSAKRAYRFT